MSKPLAIISGFRACEVWIWNPDYIETVFGDGRRAPAEFIVNDEQIARAKALGYNDDVQLMHFDHEISHTLVAEARGFTCSLVLAEAAQTCSPPIDYYWWMEEMRVLAFQRYMNDGILDPCLNGGLEYVVVLIAERLKRARRVYESVRAVCQGKPHVTD